MGAHSTVVYVEPNLQIGRYGISSDNTSQAWRVDDEYERAPRLEDYCIALDIEVEVGSRDSQGSKDTLTLQWSRTNGKETVSFMGGTRIGGYDIVGYNRMARVPGAQDNMLTTYYADMYVGDLIHYGTTEMIGIKSVDVQYEQGCVPIINIKFTDVRGYSLFQPQELNRNNLYDGIKGLDKDNVAQSFFQCFFKLPMPKFTITIKGFYGRPVSYVMMCDKFETNFNSETGDYDVDTRFIGYSYSFMTDLAFEALLAAPYSDFGGKDYWNDNASRFVIKDRNGQDKPMPRLMELYEDFYRVIKGTNESAIDTTLGEEEMYHTEEIARLKDIVDKYKNWYETLFTSFKKMYHPKYCFEFKDDINIEDSDWYRILILTNDNSAPNLGEYYKEYSDDLKSVNNNLFATIEEFNNSSNNVQKLKNISKDFSDYTKINLFNDCYINHTNKKIEFGGFVKGCPLNTTEVLNRMFYGINITGNETQDELQAKTERLKNRTLNTIYNDGIDQYTSAYLIEVDYSNITRRIKSLVADAAKSDELKDKEQKRKAYNQMMLKELCWYPSIENFSKIMMAHVETFMHMLYDVQEKAKKRTPQSLGITIGPNGNACDVNVNTKNVPPFPRIIKDEIGDDGITRKVDTWVGEFEGTERFVEEDMINGLFNGIGIVEDIFNRTNESSGTSFGVVDNGEKPLMKYPITSFDFFLTKNPYGGSEDITNNPYAFVGKVMIRMVNILKYNNLRYEYDFLNDEFVKKLGEIEAENFHYLECLGDGKVKQLLGDSSDTSVMTPQSMYDCATKEISPFEGYSKPWSSLLLLGSELDPIIGYKDGGVITTPLQGELFTVTQEFITKYDKNAVDIDNEDILANTIQLDQNIIPKIKNSKTNTLLNNLFIKDDFKIISRGLGDASTTTINSQYEEFYKMVNEKSIFNQEEYKKYILGNGVFKPRLNVLSSNNLPNGRVVYGREMIGNDGTLFVRYAESDRKIVPNNAQTGYTNMPYAYDTEKTVEFASEAENGNIMSWTFTECRGFLKKNSIYNLNPNSTLLLKFPENEKNKKEEKKTEEELLKEAYVQAAQNTIEFETNGYSPKPKTDASDEFLKNASSTQIINGIDTSNENLDNKIKFFLMGLDAINYNQVMTKLTSRTFVYLPKLAVLQIGAALDELTTYDEKSNIVLNIKKKIPVPTTFHHLENDLKMMSPLVKLSYVKYYKQWVNKYGNTINDKFYNRENYKKLWGAEYHYGKDGSTRLLFDENNSFVKGLNNQLMIPVLITNGSVFVTKYSETELDKYHITESTAISYLDGFLTKLRKLNGIKVEGNSAVRLALEPSSVTESMKKDLYRYLKLAYERWIPLTSENEWAFETFFDVNKEKSIRGDKGLGGHMFHFMDSYYNKIGDKLLLNPQIICDLISRTIESKDTNIMLLGFMGDVFGKNKCKLYSIQNFLDLSDETAMKQMFQPIPYNSCVKPNTHPDFVVVYPYQPSRYLNVDNGDYNDDSFMLNDEFSTPLPIRSRNDKDVNNKFYKIPAFGVCYGEQYQSFFKKVNVGMKTPIATVQSITAKHAILKSSQDIKHTTQAQDVYDIYAAQSYTCEVEMMGCTWIQPLMYFVLTNVPMFKGSYMVQKVTHSITPGNMVTKFIGVRMPNVANKIEDEIFTDFDDNPLQDYYSDTVSRSNALADVDNDCPYKIYPLYEPTLTLTENEKENAKNAMDVLIDEHKFTPIAAAGICGNIYQESTWQLHKSSFDGLGAFGLCQWQDKRKDNLFEFSKTKLPTFKQQIDFIPLEWQTSNKYTDGAAKHFSELQNAKTPSDSALIVSKFFERPNEDYANNEVRKAKARDYYKYYIETSKQTTSTQEEIDPNQNVFDAFFNAVQRSLNTTKRSTTIDRMSGSNTQAKNKRPDSIAICQKDGKSDKLGLVFDIILNGYFNYVQDLYWVLPNESWKDEPIFIQVVVKDKENVDKTNQKVYMYRVGHWGDDQNAQFTKSGDSTCISESFLKSVAKHYNMANENGSINVGSTLFETEVPQFKKEVFQNITIKNCDSLMEGGNLNPSNSSWAQTVASMGKWYERNVSTYQKHNYACNLTNGNVRDDCSGYVSACLQYFGALGNNNSPSSKSYYNDSQLGGLLQSRGFKKFDYSWDSVQPYDIIAYDGHVEILAEKGDKPKSWGWGSVHNGKDGNSGMPAYTGDKPKGTKYKTIWRYIG